MNMTYEDKMPKV